MRLTRATDVVRSLLEARDARETSTSDEAYPAAPIDEVLDHRDVHLLDFRGVEVVEDE